MKKPQTIGTCAILLNEQNQVVCGKRKNGYAPGSYGLPGGRIEVNEKITNTIAREIKEETGLTNLDFSYVGVVRENQGNYDFIQFVYVTHIGTQQLRLCEPDKCEGWEWFDLNQLPKDLLIGHIAALELYQKKLPLADIVL